MSAGLDFLVGRDDLRRVKVAPAEVPEASDLGSGQVLLEIERFGFSANNITYATLGDAMRYWQFFPAQDGWGRVPVWGYARLAASAHDRLDVGERVFGYLPMSTHVVVLANRVSDGGFVDAASHRSELPAVYQRYTRLGSGSDADQASEDQQALWRPLFMTSFGVADFLTHHGLFGARRIVVSSASSKTAMGTAFLLGRDVERAEIVGLTSRANLSFTEGVGYYERVLAYEGLHRLATDVPVVLLDFAGNERLIEDLRGHAARRLVHTVVVGATHWEQRERNAKLGSSDADFFFLPPWMEQRRHEWGPGEFARRYDDAWQAFLPTVKEWMRVEHHRGPAAVESVYRDMLEGTIDPAVGHMLSLWDPSDAA